MKSRLVVIFTGTLSPNLEVVQILEKAEFAT